MIEIKSGKKDINSNNINDVDASKENKPTTSVQAKIDTKVEVDALLNKIENLHVQKVESTSKNEKLSTILETLEQNKTDPKTDNYFANVAKKADTQKAAKIDEAKLKEVKAKILAQERTRYKYGSAKEMSIEESSKLLIEHENKVKVKN